MFQRNSAGPRARGGFTLVEMILGITVLAILARMLVGASDGIGGLTEAGNIEARIHRSSDEALRWIMRDLRNTGYQGVDGKVYPHILVDGVGTDGFESYTYTPAPTGAAPGDIDFGPTKGIVLCLPSDLDGNGRPELDANANGVPELDGNGDGVVTDTPADTGTLWDPSVASIHPSTKLVWSHEDVKYAVVPGPTGENELVRLVQNGAGGRRVIARSVDRIEFDTQVSAGADGSFHTDSVRVRIFFRAADSEGHVYRSRSEATVRMRNTDPVVHGQIYTSLTN
ncbi:MAG: type II secretion system protein [Planctomycetota bacterium]